jgi:putative cardiolipin synthase
VQDNGVTRPPTSAKASPTAQRPRAVHAVLVALAHPEETRLGAQFEAAAREHDGNSGFRIITVGVDGLLSRAQMISSAERTLDLQYFIFHGDETGRLLTDALLRAADRGVRVRVLVDDGDTISGDEQILALDAHRNVEVRVFSPFVYRGHTRLWRVIEFLFNARRLDYRMHNKLMVADNAVALVGGRNIGNQYFQMDPESQFADDDVFAAGPIAARLSSTFDEYWNSALAIPAKALNRRQRSTAALAARRARRRTFGATDAATLNGRRRLRGAVAGRLMSQPLVKTARAAQSELLMVTPYFIPADDELQMIRELRRRQARVRILTNSLESSPDPIAHSGYMRYREPLLEDGVELYEVRSLLGNARGSGQTTAISRFGNYALHAKLFVFDRQRLFMGSMNFDQRSKHINTEVGLIINSTELSQQTAARFDAMTQSENAYALELRP